MAQRIIENYNVARDVTIVHFLLMLGYKLFSAYFPLFLALQGFSLPQIGWSYLLIYLPIALFAPLAGFLSRKTNPALMMMLGISGYTAYALILAFGANPLVFYPAQVMLGISAALFFTSCRILLMSYPPANIERGFSWFYNANFWADIAAPIMGGLLIWKVGFAPVFALSAAITLVALAVAGFKLSRASSKLNGRGISIAKRLFLRAASPKIMPYLAISFAVLWTNGIYGAFFILFLKNALSWSNDAVIVYTAYSSAFFAIAYILFIRPLQKNSGQNSIMSGSLVSGLFSMFFALPIPFLSFVSVFALDYFRGAGLKQDPEEAGAFDTIFSPLGIAAGSLTAGLLIGFLGYQGLFFLAGAVVLAAVITAVIFQKTNENC
jgi:MFS family permease